MSVKNYTIYPSGLFPAKQEISVRVGEIIDVKIDTSFKPTRLGLDKMEFPGLEELDEQCKQNKKG